MCAKASSSVYSSWNSSGETLAQLLRALGWADGGSAATALVSSSVPSARADSHRQAAGAAGLRLAEPASNGLGAGRQTLRRGVDGKAGVGCGRYLCRRLPARQHVEAARSTNCGRSIIVPPAPRWLRSAWLRSAWLRSAWLRSAGHRCAPLQQLPTRSGRGGVDWTPAARRAAARMTQAT